MTHAVPTRLLVCYSPHLLPLRISCLHVRSLTHIFHSLFQSCSLNEASSSLFDFFLRLVHNHVIRIGGK